MARTFFAKTVITTEDRATPTIKKAAAETAKVWGFSVKSVNDKVQAANRTIGTFAKTTAFLGIAATAAGAAMVKSHSDAGDHIAKTSRRAGLAAEAYQELRFAAERAGIANDDFDRGILKLNKSLGELRTAGKGPLATWLKETPDAFQRQVRAAKTTEEAFGLIANAIDAIPDAQRRAVIAQAAFGKGASKFVNLAEGGTKAIAEVRQEAQSLGIVMSQRAAEDAEILNDRITDLTAAFGGLKTSIGVALTPVVTPLVQELTKVIVANKQVVATKATAFFGALAETVSKIEWAPLIDGAIKLVTVLGNVIETVGASNIAWAGFSVLLGGKVLGAVTATMAGIATLKTTLATFWAGGGAAATLPWIAPIAALGALAFTVKRNWEPIKAFFGEIGDGFGNVFGGIKAAVVDAIGEGTIRKISAGWDGFTTAMGKVWKLIKVDILAVWDALKPVVDGVVMAVKLMSGFTIAKGLTDAFFGAGEEIKDPKMKAAFDKAQASNPGNLWRREDGDWKTSAKPTADLRPPQMDVGPPAPAAVQTARLASVGASEPVRLTGDVVIRLVGPGAQGATVESAQTNQPGVRVTTDTGKRSMLTGL